MSNRLTQKQIETTESKDIRYVCEIDDINKWINNKKIEWKQHINRMTESRVVEIARDKLLLKNDGQYISETEEQFEY